MQSVRVQKTDVRLQSNAVLHDRELKRIASFIDKEVGIQLPVTKRSLVEGRLRKRLRLLNFNDFKDYLDYVFNCADGESEKIHLIDVLTTNKTNFYREPEHFEYLVKSVVPNLESIVKADSRHEINVWSAGCSTGEEAYTLSIVLNDYAASKANFKFNILATDISHVCLTKASRAVYTERQVEPISLELRRKYLLRSRNVEDALVKMSAELRNRVQFKSLNLMDARFSLPHKMDVIFCRNVMIYFNNKLREELVARFEDNLFDGGYLFVGHSESLNGIKTNLKQVFPMVYQKN